MLFATTDKFLRVFGLNSLDDLPVTEPLVDPEAAKKANGDSGAENEEPDPVTEE